jgi:hypothetical protein
LKTSDGTLDGGRKTLPKLSICTFVQIFRKGDPLKQSTRQKKIRTWELFAGGDVWPAVAESNRNILGS